MEKNWFLILFLGITCTSCSKIQDTMNAIEANNQAINRSSWTIHENAEAIDEATRAILENRQEVEAANRALKHASS